MEEIKTVIESVTGAIDINAFIEKIKSLLELLPAPVKELYQQNTMLCLMAVTCLLALLAFEGYKIFKMLLYSGGAFGFAYVGYQFIAPVLPDNIKEMIPDMVNADVLVAVLCALLAVFICKCANTLMIMILGGVCGYFAGSTFVYDILVDYFNTLDFLKLDMVKHIVGGAIAAVCVLLFILFFKHAYIVGTSFGCAIAAALVAQSALVPTADDTLKLSFALVGVALGIFAVVHQYKEEEKAMEIVF